MSPSNEWFLKGGSNFICWLHLNICWFNRNIKLATAHLPDGVQGESWWGAQSVPWSPLRPVPGPWGPDLGSCASVMNSCGGHIVSVSLKSKWMREWHRSSEIMIPKFIPEGAFLSNFERQPGDGQKPWVYRWDRFRVEVYLWVTGTLLMSSSLSEPQTPHL